MRSAASAVSARAYAAMSSFTTCRQIARAEWLIFSPFSIWRWKMVRSILHLIAEYQILSLDLESVSRHLKNTCAGAIKQGGGKEDRG